MTVENNSFVHRFIPARNGCPTTILALHGTGGTESDLIPLAESVAPGAAILSPRGKILENGVAPRFFRRLSEGVFDLDDLVFRTQELADFVESAVEMYDLDGGNIVALGYSNGASIAASMLLLRPAVLAGGVLLRAMIPLTPPQPPDLSGKSVLISAGLMDPIVPTDQTNGLATILEEAGAVVRVFWQAAGHGLTKADGDAAQQWLAQHQFTH